MKIITAQLNYTIGDFAQNTKKIIDTINKYAVSSDLIIFSELCVSGYYPKDLLHRPGFIEAQNNAIERILINTKEKHAAIIIGHVRVNPFSGKPFFNSISLIENGQILFTYDKQLLPTYGVFDEARHFEVGNLPGTYIWKNRRLGFLICEDAWQNLEKPRYQRDPVAGLEVNKLDLIISVNASPYSLYKYKTRYELVENIARRCNAPTIYVNQVGGIDDLVFDGNSLAFDASGNCLLDAPRFQESIDTIDFSSYHAFDIPERSETQMICDQLVTGLRDYCQKTGFKKVVIGSSGGIDSAVTIAVATLAMGSENVVAITMPSKFSSFGSVNDSEILCRALKVKLINAPIKATFDIEVASYTDAFGEPPSPLAQENLQARIRGQRLMTYSNSTGAMVVATGNKTEMSVGYCTLYGDMAGGVSLLGDLYKLQVYELANYLNTFVFKTEAIPKAIIDKAPSAELAPHQRDSDALPPYDQLDAYLQLLIEHDLLTSSEIDGYEKVISKMSEEDKVKIPNLLDRNEYKRRQAAPIIRINRRSFGADRQIPLTMNLTTF